MREVQLLTVRDTYPRLGYTCEQPVRRLIFEDVDGFASNCVVRIGRTVRIREDRLADWIEARTGAAAFKYSPDWKEKNAAAGARNLEKARAARGGG